MATPHDDEPDYPDHRGDCEYCDDDGRVCSYCDAALDVCDCPESGEFSAQLLWERPANCYVCEGYNEKPKTTRDGMIL